MEKASIEPPEEEEEERPIVNGNGVVLTPGQSPGATSVEAEAGNPESWGRGPSPSRQQAPLATEAVVFTRKCCRVEFGVTLCKL